MVFVDMLAWWYGPAWRSVWQAATRRAGNVMDAFSVSLLSRSLFAPFRQIDAGSVRGPVGVQLRAWFDRTFSRVFGFFVRSIMIFAGSLSAFVTLCAGFVWAALWVFIPVLPVIGLLLFVTGWTL